jgi:hypothetical protein
MVKMTESEWKIFCQKTNRIDAEGKEIEQKKEMEKFMQELERIQYFPTDLSYALDIGEIADMHVDFENGIQVLRMTVVPKAKDEYKTVRIAPRKEAKQTVQRKQPVRTTQKAPAKQSPVIDADKPFKISDMLIGKGKAFMAKKDKPQFMKDAGF